MRKLSLFCAALLLVCFAAAPAVKAGQSISLRVEGRDRPLYFNGALPVGDRPDATMRDVLFAYNALQGVPPMTADGGGASLRITAVGGLKENNLGSPFSDGWQIRLNGENVGGGLDAIPIKTGDDVVIYYGDPTLMQYPRIDLTRMLTDGIVRFISDDVTTNLKGSSYVTTNPIVGATVVWDGMTYMTDTAGEVIIDSTGGGVKHTVSIERYYDNGLPTILRFAPDFSVACPFRDVSGADWFYDAVMLVSGRQVMSGVSGADFRPDAPMSRVMLAVAMGRLAGVNATAPAESAFSDVDSDAWTSGYIAWAVQNGIVGGRPDGTFGPEEELTHEQLIWALFRTAGVMGFGGGGADGGGETPEAWAAAHGIAAEGPDAPDPRGIVSRAETAVMLARFIAKFIP